MRLTLVSVLSPTGLASSSLGAGSFLGADSFLTGASAALDGSGAAAFSSLGAGFDSCVLDSSFLGGSAASALGAGSEIRQGRRGQLDERDRAEIATELSTPRSAHKRCAAEGHALASLGISE